MDLVIVKLGSEQEDNSGAGKFFSASSPLAALYAAPARPSLAVE